MHSIFACRAVFDIRRHGIIDNATTDGKIINVAVTDIATLPHPNVE
jgi:hypothetical protein